MSKLCKLGDMAAAGVPYVFHLNITRHMVLLQIIRHFVNSTGTVVDTRFFKLRVGPFARLTHAGQSRSSTYQVPGIHLLG